MEVVFTRHAVNKFELLKRHGAIIARQKVVQTVRESAIIDKSRTPLLIAQSDLDQTHVLRVVYKREKDLIKIITFYPGRKKQYGKR